VQPGDELRVKILEIDSERRRLSLSAKRVEGQVLPVRRIEPEEPSEADSAAPPDDAESAPAAAEGAASHGEEAGDNQPEASAAEPPQGEAGGLNGAAGEVSQQHPSAVE